MAQVSAEELMQGIRAADAAGDRVGVQRLGLALIQMQRAGRIAKDREKMAAEVNPTNDMGTAERFFAGVGSGMHGVAQGIGQVLRKVTPNKMADSIGLPTQADVDETKQVNTPLKDTAAGAVGNVTGNVIAALPSIVLPGAATLAGSAVIGGTLGALQPVASDENRFNNTVAGTVGGTLGTLGGRAAMATWKGGRALLDPLTAAGTSRVAARTLERFGVNEKALANVTNAPTPTGAIPTLAEQIKDPTAATGAARLQDALALDPINAARLNTQKVRNNAARVDTMRELAGTEGERDLAVAMRKSTSDPHYDAAFSTKPELSNLTAQDRAEAAQLMKSDAVQKAIAEARKMASNKGIDMSEAGGSVEGLHMMKLAMDDMIANAGKSTAEVNRAMSVKVARDRLVDFIEKVSPEYANARGSYAAMSRPVNQHDVVAALLKKGTSATTDLSDASSGYLQGHPRLLPDALLRAAGDEGRLIREAVGREIPEQTLADLLDPQALHKVQSVVGETNRLAAVERAGAGKGSPSAQRLASTNVLRQTLGPTGLPQSWAESTLLSTLMRPLQYGYSLAEPNIQRTLGDFVMEPELARAALARIRSTNQRLPQQVQDFVPLLEHIARTAPGATAASNQR